MVAIVIMSESTGLLGSDYMIIYCMEMTPGDVIATSSLDHLW
jgi:hypothetical protein